MLDNQNPISIKSYSKEISLLQKENSPLSPSTTKTETHSNNSRVTKIFSYFVLWYGNAWSKKVESQEMQSLAMTTWSKIISNLNSDQLNRGIKNCPIEFKTFPPTPGEFRDMCLISAFDLGAPTRDEAYYLAAKKDLKNPFVNAAYEKIGNWRFSHSKEYEIKNDFFDIYDALIRRARETGEVPAPLKMIENNSASNYNPDDSSPHALASRQAKIIVLLKQTHFSNVKWNMQVATELAEIFELRKRAVMHDHPELDQLSVISILERVAKQELAKKL